MVRFLNKLSKSLFVSGNSHNQFIHHFIFRQLFCQLSFLSNIGQDYHHFISNLLVRRWDKTVVNVKNSRLEFYFTRQQILKQFQISHSTKKEIG